MYINGYYYDRRLKDSLNAAGENYWECYFEEIFDSLGAKAVRIESLSGLGQNARLKFLMVGKADVSQNIDELKKFVSQGGSLLLFATEGCEDLLDFENVEYVRQVGDCFSISAHAAISEDFAGTACPGAADIALPVFSDFMKVSLKPDSDVLVLADLFPGQQQMHFPVSGKCPAIMKKHLGKGTVYYFVFSVTQTLCVLQQGRPVISDYDGDGYYRTGDGIALTPEHDLWIPYADLYRSILVNILSDIPQPFIYELPPADEGGVCDFLIHCGGDDEGWDDDQMQAHEVMSKKGIPYHVNLMLKEDFKTFAISREQFEYMEQNNTCPSMHFNFVFPDRIYTQNDINEQLDKYIDAFGKIPKISVNHCVMFTGWADHARWCSFRGLKGDNSKINVHLGKVSNPLNSFGLAYGSTYPSYVYDDGVHNNQRLDFVSMPISFFEPRIYNETRDEDMKRIDDVIDISLFYRFTINLFLHPVYLVKEPACVRAVDYIIDKIKIRGLNVIFTNNDFLCDWWFDRSGIDLADVVFSGHECRFHTGSTRDFFVKMKSTCVDYSVDDILHKTEHKTILGKIWSFLKIPKGSHLISVMLPV